jgi:hypothetical protein
MPTKEDALRKINSLVERFEEQIKSYKKADYNETQTRRDFIDPFWKALGWGFSPIIIAKFERQLISKEVLLRSLEEFTQFLTPKIKK